MFVEPAPIEQVYQVIENDDQTLLKTNFSLFYRTLIEGKLTPDAKLDTIYGIHRALSGLANPYYNALFGVPEAKDWDKCIEEQLKYFKAKNLPFVWYVDEEANAEFKEKLIRHGFNSAGIFRGVMGELNKPIPFSQLPEGYSLERVVDETTLKEQAELVCQIFSIPNADAYFRVMKKTLTANPIRMYHWVAKKRGKVVSTLSTIIDGDLVSFKNGATLPEERCHGLSSALRQMALRDAISRGCKYGASYLMEEGMAFGICAKLGFETRWCFNAFIAP